MQKKILLLFICFVTIPIIIIYSVATYIFNHKAETNLKDIYTNDIKNIARTVENYFSESLELTMYPLLEQNLYKFYTVPSDNTEFYKILSNANTILTSSPYVFGGNRGAILLRRDGISITTNSVFALNKPITDEQMRQADLLNGECYWDLHPNNTSPLFSITRLIKSKSDFTVPLGYIRTTISSKELYNSIKNAIIEKGFHYFILDKSNQVILSTDKNHDYSVLLTKYNYDSLSSLSEKSVCVVLNGDYFIAAQKIRNTPYIICSVINPDVFTATKATLANILSGIAILTAFFFVMLSFVFTKFIVKPLTELGNKMLSISDENFAVQIDVKGKDEIAVLANQFNQMAERLQYLYNQVYMRELELKKSQLTALQSQINPHFLYNTMDTIYWMSEMGNTKDVSNIVSNMSKLFRLTLAPNDNDTISLREELEHLNYYMEIQKIRYHNSIDFHLENTASSKEVPVLRFLLQPLVENALIHGMKDQPYETILIKIYEENHYLFYKIMNNGTLIDIPLIRTILLTESSEAKGFALRNIHKRLMLKYGNEYGLSFAIEQDFSIFTVKQPIL